MWYVVCNVCVGGGVGVSWAHNYVNCMWYVVCSVYVGGGVGVSWAHNYVN